MKKAMDQGIVVISHEAPSAENVHYDVEAFQNAAYGEHLMQALAKEMGEEGEYAIILGSIQAQTHKEWSDAAVAYQKEHYPNMKLVADYVESNENQDTAKTKTQELMKTYPNLKGIIGCSVIDPRDIPMQVVFEEREPALAEQYDYYYVPTFYVDGVKRHEGALTREKLKAVLDEALG